MTTNTIAYNAKNMIASVTVEIKKIAPDISEKLFAVPLFSLFCMLIKITGITTPITIRTKYIKSAQNSFSIKLS